MDLDERKLLTDDERGHFRKWEQFFESDGWELLLKELSAEAETAPAELFWGVRSWDELVAARSRMQTVNQLIAYPDIIKLRKENLMQQRDLELEDALEANRPDV